MPADVKHSKPRPSILRALGQHDPPVQIEVDGRVFERKEIFKHDSWAATALYEADGTSIVCKFNRTHSMLGIPCKWIGHRLAKREGYFLHALNNIPGIPRVYRSIRSGGRVLSTAVAHDYVAGQPLSLVLNIDESYFQKLELLLAQLHQRRIAYIDLHKAENVLVGNDGLPYLIDFQISAQLPTFWPLGSILRMLQTSDRYHLLKHKAFRLDYQHAFEVMRKNRPWWIRLHRKIAVPLRTIRRRLLVAMGVRSAQGMAHTEQTVEPGLSRATGSATGSGVFSGQPLTIGKTD